MSFVLALHVQHLVQQENVEIEINFKVKLAKFQPVFEFCFWKELTVFADGSERIGKKIETCLHVFR